MPRTIRTLAALLLASTATTGTAATVASEVRLTATVPTICNVNFSGGMTKRDETSLDLGMMARFCNDASGYRVIVHTAEGLVGATFVHGAARVPLSATGETIVLDRNSAEIGTEPAQIEFGTASPLPNQGAIEIRVEAKGVIF